MNTLRVNRDIKSLIASFSAAAMVVLAGVVLLAPSAGAITMANVSPASGTVELVEGETLKLVVTAELAAGETLRELEVDHSYDNTIPTVFPEFSVYADETDPYNNQWATPVETGQEAIFTSLGTSVTYSASANQWVLDFGQPITDRILADGGDVTFYFALKGVDGAGAPVEWGSIAAGVTAENTFAYSLEIVEPSEDDEAAPGVPNTAAANGPTTGMMVLIGSVVAAVLAGGVAVVRRQVRT